MLKNEDYAKNNYIKYKNKYLNLKNNMKGGYGGATLYWNQHNSYELENKDNNLRCILNGNYNSSNTQSSKYKIDLDKLLNFDDCQVNIDFINNFYRKIYYDYTNEYEIVDSTKEEEKSYLGKIASYVASAFVEQEKKVPIYEFKKDIKYNIYNTSVQPHLNTTIFFLKRIRKIEPKQEVKESQFSSFLTSISKINEIDVKKDEERKKKEDE
jgi:hypothetical protein